MKNTSNPSDRGNKQRLATHVGTTADIIAEHNTIISVIVSSISIIHVKLGIV